MKPLIIANWKLNKTLAETVRYLQTAVEPLSRLTNVDVVICPPFTSIAVAEGLVHGTNVKLGAQTVSRWKEGAHTGEVSAAMLAGHCQYVIVGHSERRKFCAETPDQINDQIKRCLEHKLQPVVCVSNLAELEALTLLKDKMEHWILAYEPVAAIGTGRPEDPAEVTKMRTAVRKALGKSTRVLYGGSTKPANIRTYLEICDGALVGGASLDPHEFLDMCTKANR